MLKNRLQNFALLFHKAANKGILLLLATIVAIILANTESTGGLYKSLVYHESYILGISTSLHTFTNDFLMAIFFLLVGLEIKREMIDGNLATTKQRILPVAAALGGVVVPVLIYSLINFSDPIKMRGWAIPTATDIAFALGMLALLGRGLPVSLRVFLTALAIIDDLIAVIIISLFYSAGIDTYYLGMAVVIVLFIIGMNLVRLNNIVVYGIFGLALWYAFLRSGIHASIAGVVLGFCVQYDKANTKGSILVKMEERLSSLVLYAILPIFAFVNSGVVFELSSALFANTIILGIAAGLVIGKQLGIFATSYYLIKNKYAVLPANATWGQLYGVTLLCGVGFTMSLFIGHLAFADFSPYLNDMRFGVLLGSLVSAFIGGVYLRMIRG